jgi:hypothetical protein
LYFPLWIDKADELINNRMTVKFINSDFSDTFLIEFAASGFYV